MKRRDVLKLSMCAALLPTGAPARAADVARVRPGMAGWPAEAEWEGVRRATGGRLMALSPPFAACAQDGLDARACQGLLRDLQSHSSLATTRP